ncbi:MAG TPA: HAD family hydrolase [bacterium]|nr:HAD family hydrolase [bacterium]
MRFDYIFVDLDDSLMDTKKYKARLFDLLVEYGVPMDLAKSTYKQIINTYTFENQLAVLRDLSYDLPPEVLPKMFDLLKINYLLPGARDFLEYLRSQTEHLVLVSNGNPPYQQLKIDSLGISDFFDQIAIGTDGKDAVLVKFSADFSRSLFINDKLDENERVRGTFPGLMITGLINRKYWTIADYEQAGYAVFENLADLGEYLKKL